MVLLTMTSTIVAVLRKHPELQKDADACHSANDASLAEPEVGKPISHGQVLEIFNHVKQNPNDGDDQIHLPDLLRGSQVYAPPAQPKTEPTSEFKELMARLRRGEESKAYAKMLNPLPKSKNPFEKFTAPKTAAAWDLQSQESEIDETKMSDVNRQLALIINVLVSIIACGIAAWVVLRHWSVPSRLLMSMSCGGIVGIAEVGIYAAYVRKLSEANSVEKTKTEKKFITDTWVIGGTKSEKPEALSQRAKASVHGNSLRRRQI